MHRIDRDAVPVPACLNQPRRYTGIHGQEKEEIRRSLLAIQGDRCAYCERRTADGNNDGHIEHFRKQAEHPHLELDWANLFWSCKDENTCGKYKDKCTRQAGELKWFNPDDIINPATEDPEALLVFVWDGTVHPRDGLSEADRHRAEETLRVFHLNGSSLLRKLREDAVKPIRRSVETMMTRDPQLVEAYVDSELNAIAEAPFSTAIMSFLKSLVSS